MGERGSVRSPWRRSTGWVNVVVSGAGEAATPWLGVPAGYLHGDQSPLEAMSRVTVTVATAGGVPAVCLLEGRVRHGGVTSDPFEIARETNGVHASVWLPGVSIDVRGVLVGQTPAATVSMIISGVARPDWVAGGVS